MSETAVEKALKARVATNSTGLSIAWPNQAHPGTKPFLAVDIVRIARTDPTIAGGKTISQGRLVLNVVVDINTSTATANGHADTLANLFPFPLRIPFAGGHIQISKPADIREGYRTDGEWRVPVLVDYRAFY